DYNKMISGISRAIILANGKILLIHRFNNGEEYYVPPGGHIEKGESEEEALLREIKEETGLNAEIDKKLWVFKNPIDKSKNHFFLVTKFMGRLHLGGPELKRSTKNNRYTLEWHDLKDIFKLPILPKIAKKKVIKELLT
ncbi:MAG TPA: NUDIX domain-containing protein, partial [Patescibacteria group bacterium]|nr:NUDIX domain-containing protein [Patescibacteria group bacterium]